jgi:lipopolysaccharide transport system permease protein
MDLTTGENASRLERASAPPRDGAPAAEKPPAAPARPLVRIEPRGARRLLDVGELWAYRELLYFLMWRDVKVRYKQTALGVAWIVLQPLLTMLVFTVIFGRLARLPSDGVPYAIFAYAGLLPWTFFANAVNVSGNSLVGSSHLITKVYFPRLIIPAAAVGALLVDFALAFLLLGALMLYYGVAPTAALLAVVPLVGLTVLLAVSTGLLLSALNVKYRDVRHVIPFMVQMWMFASPVIYPVSIVPERWRWLAGLNPLTGIIEGFRAALFPGKPFDWTVLGVSVAATVLLFFASVYAFRRMEREFADII